MLPVHAALLMLHPTQRCQSRLKGGSNGVHPAGNPDGVQLTLSCPAAAPCPPAGASSHHLAPGAPPPGGGNHREAFSSSAVRGKVFFFPVHHGRCFENYSQKKLLKKENQKAYKTDSTLLLVISTDIKLLCQFSPNISKCLLSIFVLSPHMVTTIWGPARPSDVSGRGAQGGFSSPRVASCPSASPAQPLLGPPCPSWTT